MVLVLSDANTLSLCVAAGEGEQEQTPAAGIFPLSTLAVCPKGVLLADLPTSPRPADPGSHPHRKGIESFWIKAKD